MKLPPRTALPLADAAALRPYARRTSAVRWLLAAAVLAAIAVGWVTAPSGDVARASAAGGRGTVVILDVSGSITDRGSAEIQHSLADAIRAAGPSGRLGLVLFSDTSMEALPPTAPVAGIQQFRRFFIAERSTVAGARISRGAAAAAALAGSGSRTLPYPQSPWGVSFSGGTEISTGLREARADLRRAGLVGGRVLLLSDLIDAPQDLPALRRELRAYAHDPLLDLRVRVLTSSVAQPLALYRQYLGRNAVLPAQVGPPPPLRTRVVYPLPLWLVAVALLGALLLTANELVGAPLRWRRRLEAVT